MARKKTDDTPDEGAPGWMVTYGDMMGLLLTFFILIVSFSSIQQSKFEKAAGSLSAALGVLPMESGVRQNTQMVRVGKNMMDENIESAQAMQAEIAEKNLQGLVKVILTDKGIKITVADPVLFDIGKADLKTNALPVLDIIANLINKNPNSDIIVEGHTDNVPIANDKFPSNWELSSARALTVVRYLALTKGFDPSRFAATGYGEFKPVKPNDSEDNRAKNRRVEILINNRPPALENSADSAASNDN